MEKLYPDAPVPKVADGLVIHRAVLHDLTGVPQLLDWLSDGEAAIVVTFAKFPPRDVISFTAFKADAVADVSVGVSVKAFVLPDRTVIPAKVVAAAGATVAVIDVAATVLSVDASAAVI